MNVTFNEQSNELIFTDNEGNYLFQSELISRQGSTKEFSVPYNNHTLFDDMDFVDVNQQPNTIKMIATIDDENLLELIGDEELTRSAINVENDDDDEVYTKPRMTPTTRAKKQYTTPSKPEKPNLEEWRNSKQSKKYELLDVYTVTRNLKTAIINNDDDVDDRIAFYVKVRSMLHNYKPTSGYNFDEMKEFMNENQDLTRVVQNNNYVYSRSTKEDYNYYEKESLQQQTIAETISVAGRFCNAAKEINRLSEGVIEERFRQTTVDPFVDEIRQAVRVLADPLKDNLVNTIVNGSNSSELDYNTELNGRTDVYVETLDVFSNKKTPLDRLETLVTTIRDNRDFIEPVEQTSDRYKEAMDGLLIKERPDKVSHDTKFFGSTMTQIAKRFDEVAQRIMKQTDDPKVYAPFTDKAWRCLDVLQFPDLKVKDYDRDAVRHSKSFKRTTENKSMRVKRYLGLTTAISYMEELNEFRSKYASLVTGVSMFPRRHTDPEVSVRTMVEDAIKLADRYEVVLDFNDDPSVYYSMDIKEALNNKIMDVL